MTFHALRSHVHCHSLIPSASTIPFAGPVILQILERDTDYTYFNMQRPQPGKFMATDDVTRLREDGLASSIAIFKKRSEPGEAACPQKTP